MKRVLSLCLCLLLLPLSSLAAEAKGVSVVLIDTGISTAVISKDSILEGKNYVREGYDTEDSIGHGTAMAGLILKHAPNTQLVPLTYCDEVYCKQISCNLDVVAKMVRDAVDSYHCSVINISAATTIDYEPLREAIAYAEEQNVVVIAAAGNSGTDKANYPASYGTVIGVGALNQDGKVANFSQRAGVSLVALGEKLPVILPNGEKALATGSSFACA